MTRLDVAEIILPYRASSSLALATSQVLVQRQSAVEAAEAERQRRADEDAALLEAEEDERRANQEVAAEAAEAERFRRMSEGAPG